MLRFAIVLVLAAAVGCRSPALDAVAERAVEHGFPGMTIAVGTPDGAIRTGAAGLADRAAGVPMAPDSQVHAASTTKAVTAAAALLLVDRGRLALDARLPDVLPESAWVGLPHAADISVRDLLLHTSGLYSPNNDPVYLARYIGPERLELPFWTPEQIVRFAADPERPPAFMPGAGHSYSDINYVLLGLVVGAVDGRPLKTFVREEILEPLAMRATYYLSDDPGRPRARAYTVDSPELREAGLDPAMVADADGLIDTTDAQEQSDAAAGLVTTTPDLVRFARALTRGDLLSPSSRELMLEVAGRAGQPGELPAQGALRAYRMPYGLIVTAEGDGPGINVVWALDVASGRVVAVAVNRFGGWDEAAYLLEAALPEALDAVGASR